MKYGVVLPNVGPLAHIDTLVDLACRAEALDYDGIFLSDHIAIPTELHSAYPYRTDGRFPLAADDNILWRLARPVSPIRQSGRVAPRPRRCAGPPDSATAGTASAKPRPTLPASHNASPPSAPTPA